MLILRIISITKTIMSMENKYQIIELWSSLKNLATIGLVKKLYDTKLPIQVYATYSYPDDIIGIADGIFKQNIYCILTTILFFPLHTVQKFHYHREALFIHRSFCCKKTDQRGCFPKNCWASPSSCAVICRKS